MAAHLQVEKAFLKARFDESKSRLLLLDYDGTLVEFVDHPADAISAPALVQVIHQLASQANTKLAIISGRSAASLDVLWPDVPFEMVAEHGAFLKQKNEWIRLLHEDNSWKQAVSEILLRFTDRCANSFVEEKESALAWHYRNCEVNEGIAFSRHLIFHLQNCTSEHDLKITDGNKVVEINSAKIHKGSAVSYFLNEGNYDFILCIGDDRTDEDMFSLLQNDKRAHTIKVGNGNSLAKFRLQSVSDVFNLLQYLTG